jgi:pimeloyl-ACP methyl ester carboxylesterase
MSIAMALRPHRATAPVLLQRLRRPLLLIWGRHDQLVPLDVGHQCRRHRADLPLAVLEAAGHCPHDENSEAFNSTLLGWLAQLEPAGAYLGASQAKCPEDPASPQA